VQVSSPIRDKGNSVVTGPGGDPNARQVGQLDLREVLKLTALVALRDSGAPGYAA